MICACAVDSEHTFTTHHFGDCSFFELFEVQGSTVQPIGHVQNTITKEGKAKGQSISSLLREHQVEVVLSRRFGLNIEKIRKHFYPVLVRIPSCSPQQAVKIAAERLQSMEIPEPRTDYPILYLD